MTVARTHGHLARFLAQCASHLDPILHWRARTPPKAIPSAPSSPTSDELTDAETAVRPLATMLHRTGRSA
ncbi:hypothetical protein AB0A71_04560 [Kitasatospora aureofaciens]|uniref:hypothetical protein n=1 Tax=Kitasatospora aureofaciens TaxID=1894 RepID=UPI0033FA215B